MDDSTNNLIQYCLDHSSPSGEVLHALERETYLKTLAPQMLSGPLQGALLMMLSKMIRPKNILEIGTFTGYSAICLAQGLAPGGRLHTIEVNEEIQYISKKYFLLAGLTEQIRSYLGDAADIIPTIDGTYDLVFIDAGKKDYGKHYDLVIDQINSGGYILVDNVLWSQKVIAEQLDQGAQTVDHFNKKIRDDDRVENVVLPIRDGLTIIRKK
jgi:predicted O-methyltransferase YrrM